MPTIPYASFARVEDQDGRVVQQWVLGKAWRLGILRYDADHQPYWHGETHLWAEDAPFGECDHDHQRGVTIG